MACADHILRDPLAIIILTGWDEFHIHSTQYRRKVEAVEACDPPAAHSAAGVVIQRSRVHIWERSRLHVSVQRDWTTQLRTQYNHKKRETFLYAVVEII